jgi:uncharacterized protein YbjT (DUF2867 family)
VRILLTGATGRLGRALVPRLVQAGHDLRATSRRVHPGQHGVEWTVADLASGAGLAQAVAGVDAVVHLASAPYKGAYTVRVDVDGTRRLAAAAREAGVKHLLYASIVGIDRVPWPYFRRKLAAEALVKSGGMGWSIVRDPVPCLPRRRLDDRGQGTRAGHRPRHPARCNRSMYEMWLTGSSPGLPMVPAARSRSSADRRC